MRNATRRMGYIYIYIYATRLGRGLVPEGILRKALRFRTPVIIFIPDTLVFGLFLVRFLPFWFARFFKPFKGTRSTGGRNGFVV